MELEGKKEGVALGIVGLVRFAMTSPLTSLVRSSSEAQSERDISVDERLEPRCDVRKGNISIAVRSRQR